MSSDFSHSPSQFADHLFVDRSAKKEHRRDQDATTSTVSSGRTCEKKKLDEALRRRDTNCSDKRRDLDRNWDQVCRKSEPKIDF